MSDPNQSIFISYRREASIELARAIFRLLKVHGDDVFWDIASLGGEQPESIILNQIAARPHFVVLIAAGTLERCSAPRDYLRREIEFALELKRNIIPILVEGYNFEVAKPHLTDKLTRLMDYQALELYYRRFKSGMETLRKEYLVAPTQSVTIYPTPPQDQVVLDEKIELAEKVPAPTQKELRAEKYFNRALTHFRNGDFASAITAQNEAIHLNPRFANVYHYRGLAELQSGYLKDAIRDYCEAIHLNPQDTTAYYNRGRARDVSGDLTGAIADYNEAIRFNPQHAEAYHNRGNALRGSGDLKGALANLDEAIRLNPQLISAYYNRGNARQNSGDLQGAIDDLQKFLDLGGGIRDGDQEHVEERIRDLKKELKK